MTDFHPSSGMPDGLQAAPADPHALAVGLQATLRTLDLGAVDDKADLMARLARDLTLPAHFGRNWDALYDLLADALVMRPTVLCLGGWTGFRERHPRLAAELESVLLDAQRELTRAGIPLWVLV